LEDAGYYCVDNLPPELLLLFVQLEDQNEEAKVAIAMDVRSANALHLVPAQLAQLRAQDVHVRLLFLDASTDTLVHRFSETRRNHPLSHSSPEGAHSARDLVAAIELERTLLADLREESHIIDTSLLRASKLQSYIHALVSAPSAQLTLMFESFAFKRGIPVHADFVFDVRMLPNPHYETELRPQTGRDQPVADWLKSHEQVKAMELQIAGFLERVAALIAKRPPQLCDRGHRLHGWSAPLCVFGGKLAQAFQRRVGDFEAAPRARYLSRLDSQRFGSVAIPQVVL
jgi:RNase adapter protein RapZ